MQSFQIKDRDMAGHFCEAFDFLKVSMKFGDILNL